MIQRLFQHLVAVNLVLCMILHSMGSTAGAYLCVGCDGQWDAIAVATDVCETSATDCCGNPPASQHEDGEIPDCGCVDLALSAHEGTIGQSADVFVPAPAPCPISLQVSPARIEAIAVAAGESRAGPLLVRQLNPRALSAILLI